MNPKVERKASSVLLDNSFIGYFCFVYKKKNSVLHLFMDFHAPELLVLYAQSWDTATPSIANLLSWSSSSSMAFFSCRSPAQSVTLHTPWSAS